MTTVYRRRSNPNFKKKYYREEVTKDNLGKMIENGVFYSIRDLKMYPKIQDVGVALCDKDQPISVITGPTGSGKTIGTIKLIASLLSDRYKKVPFHTTYFSIPSIQGTRNAYNYSQNNTFAYYEKKYMGWAAGRTCAYRDNQQIKVCTTRHVFNSLLRLLANRKENWKLQTTLVIIDEAHVPSIENYLLMALCLYIRKKGYRLRISIMSATLESAPLISELESSNKLELEGRLFPLQYNYLNEDPETKDALIYKTVKTIKELVQKKGKGILVFVSGEKDIDQILGCLQHNPVIDACGLHSKMPEEEIQYAYTKPKDGCVKVVVATNAAESSLTIKGISIVIDTLREIKVRKSIIGRGTVFEEVTVSKSSATQRAGRAGRVEAGEVYRMCTKGFFDRLVENNQSEFYSTDPHMTVLELLKVGNKKLDPKEILMIEEERYDKIFQKLNKTGLVDKEGSVTDLGASCLKFQASLEISIFLAHLSLTECETTKAVGSAIAGMIEGFQGYLPFWVPKDERRTICKNGHDLNKFGSFYGKDDIETYNNIFFGDSGMLLKSDLKESGIFDQIKNTNKYYKEWSKDNSMNNKLIKQAVRNCRSFLHDTLPRYGKIAKDRSCIEIEIVKQCINPLFFKMSIDGIEFREKILNNIRRCFMKVFPDEIFKPNWEGYCHDYISYKLDRVRSFNRIHDLSVDEKPKVIPINIAIIGKNRFISCIVEVPKC